MHERRPGRAAARRTPTPTTSKLIGVFCSTTSAAVEPVRAAASTPAGSRSRGARSAPPSAGPSSPTCRSCTPDRPATAHRRRPAVRSCAAPPRSATSSSSTTSAPVPAAAPRRRALRQQHAHAGILEHERQPIAPDTPDRAGRTRRPPSRPPRSATTSSTDRSAHTPTSDPRLTPRARSSAPATPQPSAARRTSARGARPPPPPHPASMPPAHPSAPRAWHPPSYRTRSPAHSCSRRSCSAAGRIDRASTIAVGSAAIASSAVGEVLEHPSRRRRPRIACDRTRAGAAAHHRRTRRA